MTVVVGGRHRNSRYIIVAHIPSLCTSILLCHFIGTFESHTAGPIEYRRDGWKPLSTNTAPLLFPKGGVQRGVASKI